MNLAEVKARHEALIKWSVFDGYTNEALIALVKTLHADRGWLIERLEAIEKLPAKWRSATDVYSHVRWYDCAHDVEALLK